MVTSNNRKLLLCSLISFALVAYTTTIFIPIKILKSKDYNIFANFAYIHTV
jgi:hypothetical protein